jgi:serine/threonine-protein kinase RsbW
LEAGALPGIERNLAAHCQRIEVILQSRLDSVQLAEEISACVAASHGFGEEDKHRICLAIREGVANAVFYGNQQRPEKLVRLIFEVDGGRFVVRIHDEGCGFSLEDVPDPQAEENLLKTSGRGIFLMRAFMDELKVLRASGGGAELVMAKRLPPDSDPTA